MSDAGPYGQPGPQQPPAVTPPAWYASPSVAPPPPGAKFQPTKKKGSKARRILASGAFLVFVLALAGVAAKTGVGQKKQQQPNQAGGENPARVGDEAGGPTVDDHWHEAYGIYLCKGYIPPLQDAIPDALGIHTHGDGLIHTHPFVAESAGANAKLSVFLDQIGVTLDNDGITMPDGGRFDTEAGCEGKEARLLVAVWPTADTEKPEVYEKDFDRLRFLEDGEVWTIALVPTDGHLEKPDSVANLANPGDL